MPPAMFDELLNSLSPRLTWKDTNFRLALHPCLLAVSSYHKTPSLWRQAPLPLRVSRHPKAIFLLKVCQAIVDHYKDTVIACPVTQGDWKIISLEFELRRNLAHAVAALDGKHIAIRKPHGSGSLYHNYKGFFSIVLLALVDANYRFLWVDVGGLGHMSDAQIFNAAESKECKENDNICLPKPEPLPNSDLDMPYFILADDAFALRQMKPYSRRGLSEAELIANYRISSARRVVD
ncbi:uncharacterized protein LOC124280671 [Haliotis rubra]|uniref:uncharacterized protein LOC124280671 n=1 Tax=Haliotis rubra TaxID=36100 RepID=UPI001EE5DF2B|nr:uncharacterized protein LOC124280671 [Haliotis rubra]